MTAAEKILPESLPALARATVAEVKALLEFASTDVSRVGMCGIGISEGRLAATDGHTAVIRGATPRDSWSHTYAVPTDLWATAIRGAKAGDTVEVFIDENGVRLVCGPTAVAGHLAPFAFPPLHAVLPEPQREAASHIGIAAGAFLSRLPKIDAAIASVNGRRKSHQTWVLACGGELDPILLTAEPGGDSAPWLVVIMPVRL